MNERTAVILGASGLTGSYLVQEMLKDNYFDIVRLLVRELLPLQHQKLQQVIIDFDNLDDFKQKFGDGETIFCCVGTTIKKVKGDIAAYEKIDYNIPYNAAAIGVSKNYKKFLIVSSVGADVKSRNFYLKLKGKTEMALKKFPFDSISIFRPGQLLGNRIEYRRGEKLLQASTKFMSGFLFGSLNKYHSIEARDVAKAMIAAAKRNETGVHILEYNEIKKLIS